MALGFVVPTKFTVQDKMTGPLGAIQGKVDKFASSASSALSRIVPKGGIFGSLVGQITIGNLLSKGIASATGAIKSNIGSAINYASDLIEVQNVVDTVFGNSSSAIDEFAKKATDSFGLTQLQAKKFSSTIGAVFGGMGISGGALTQMSTQIAGLAGDLASFYNLDIEDAFSKLKSGITGETEPLKQLGIVMSQANLEAFALSKGIRTTWKNMDQAAQTTLRYQFIMEKTALAQGDYAKPIDSYAVSSRNLTNAIDEMKGKLAVGFMPTLIKVADTITGIVRKISDWADANRELVAKKLENSIDKIKKAAQMLSPVMRSIIGGVKNIATNLSPLIDRTKGWIDANRGLIETGIQNAVEKISAAVERLVPWISRALEFVIRFAPEIATFIGVLWGLKTVLGVVSVAMGVLNAVMTANPVSLVVLAVAALITAFVILANKVGGVGNAFKVVGQTIMKLLLTPFNLLLSGIDAVASAFTKVDSAGETFRILGQTIMKFLLTPINLVIGAVGSLLSAVGHIPGADWAKTGAEAIHGLQDKMNTVITGSESTLWNSGGRAFFDPAREAMERGEPTAVKKFQDQMNASLTGSASTFWDSGLEAYAEPYRESREVELLRQEAARNAAGDNGKVDETNDLLRQILVEGKRNTEAVAGLGETGSPGIPGRLNYSMMGREDFWELARSGL